MTTPSDRTLVEDALANAIDDWLYEAWICQIVRRSGLDNPLHLRTLSIGLIAELVTSGLVLAGDLVGGDYLRWELSPGEAIIRIASEWMAWGDTIPTPGSIVWLAVTPAGELIGRAVLEREAA